MINIIFCIFLVIIGVVFVAFPKDIYDSLERWKTINDNGPSNKYIIFTKLFGFTLIADGIVGIIILLI